MTGHVVTIDPDLTVRELIRLWHDGRKYDVISTLAGEHAGLTALLIVQGLDDAAINRSTAREIANALVDARKAAFDAPY